MSASVLLSKAPRFLELLQAGMRDGLHIGAQVFVSQQQGSEPATTILDDAVGESKPGVAMTPDSIVLWLSASKPVAAVALLQLVERGVLQLDDPVARNIPEFGVHGKEPITLMNLLTHTGGFRWVDTGWPDADWTEIIRRICRMKLEPDWVPGQTAGYHPYTSWYILGEVVRRVDGRPYSEYVRDEIFLPLDMDDCWIGMPAEHYEAYGDRLGQLQNTAKVGGPPHAWDSREGYLHCAPGGSGHGPMRQLAHFYQMLLGGGERDGVRLLQPSSVQNMTAVHRTGIQDLTFQSEIDWGLGLLLNTTGGERIPYGYGDHASPQAFGHSGSQSSVAFADPEFGIAGCLMLNGMPGEPRHQRRIRPLLTALYEDLELAGQILD